MPQKHAQPSWFKQLFGLPGILLLAFALRGTLLLLADRPEGLMTSDSADYIRLARSISLDHMFGTSEQPEIFRVPGYPLLLSTSIWLFHLPGIICLIQILMGTATCFLTYRLARKLSAGTGTALTACFFQAVSVVSIVYACRVLSESLFTLVFTTFLLLVFPLLLPGQNPAGKPDRQQCRSTLAGGILAVAVYIRAVALPFALMPVFFLVLRRQYKRALLMAATLAACLLPWYARNAVLADFHGFSSVAAINLYRYNACMLLADQNSCSFADQQARITRELAKEETQTAAAELARRRGLRTIVSHPLNYAVLHALTIPRNLLPASGELLQTFGCRIGGNGTLALIQSKGIAAGVKHYFGGRTELLIMVLPLVAWTAAVYLLALSGIWPVLRNPQIRRVGFFLLATVIYFLAVPGGAAHPRFRVPIMPIFAVFAAFGWEKIRQLVKRPAT